MKGLDRQREIYLAGAAGRKPVVPVDYQTLRAAAQRVLSHRAFTYIDGGAGLRRTLVHNTDAFAAWRILPRMLHGNDRVETTTTVLGQGFSSPVMTAPVGVLELAHRSADIGLAQACHATDTPMIFSSQASRQMEDCAEVMGATPRWFQLYWSTSEELVLSFVKRAETCGCTAIVVTLDTTVLGWRTPDLDAAFIPFIYAQGIAQYTSDPVFQKLVDAAPKPERDPAQTVTFESFRTLLRMARRYPGRTI
ncbi:MAG: alpha-hydroxy-acid oxidizing protein, partial [Saprospiraceae bacterium]|nr:alpha-hydroxy-acid oxidizing protein [Saprospiraceae bacterium]